MPSARAPCESTFVQRFLPVGLRTQAIWRGKRRRRKRRPGSLPRCETRVRAAGLLRCALAPMLLRGGISCCQPTKRVAQLDAIRKHIEAQYPDIEDELATMNGFSTPGMVSGSAAHDGTATRELNPAAARFATLLALPQVRSQRFDCAHLRPACLCAGPWHLLWL